MGLFETTEISETCEGTSSTHRVGPFAGQCAGMFWTAVFGFITTILAFSTTYWHKVGETHSGLWKSCETNIYGEDECSKIISIGGAFKTIQALVTLSFIASLATLALAIIYTFVHSLSKSVILLLVMAAAGAAAACMGGGFTYYLNEVKGKNIGWSIYAAWLAEFFDIGVGVLALSLKQKSEAERPPVST